MPKLGFMHLSVTTWGFAADMGESKGMMNARRKSLFRWLPGIAETAADRLGATRLETLEIMTDVDQVSTLFASLDDVRRGHIVNISEAFGDL
jgi:hypothetical protein